MRYLTETMLDFLTEIRANNEKTWFEAHKEVYLHAVYEPLKALSEILYQPYAEYGMMHKTARIYKDANFPPYLHYRDTFWIYIRHEAVYWNKTPTLFFEISPECAAILRDIDSIATALKPLAEQDIPVLWRPLPEAGGGWYWWGADGAASYRWLWNLLWHRMTDYHQLHNLIWVWNGQSQDFLVDYYDIAAMDIYLDENQQFQSRYEDFHRS